MRKPSQHRRNCQPYSLAGAKETTTAIEAAHKALEGWKALAGAARSEILHRAANFLDEHKEDLARTMTREMGKPIGEARGEVKRGVVLLRYYAGEGMRAMARSIRRPMARRCFIATAFPWEWSV